MTNPDEFIRAQIGLQVTRALRRVRYHRAEANQAEVDAAETSLNGWLEQYGRTVEHANAAR